MLKCDLNKENDASRIEVKGNALEIMVDLSCLFNHLYNVFNSNSPILGAIFKETMQESIADDNSPIWKVRAGQKQGKDGIKAVSFQIPGDLFDNFRGGRAWRIIV